MKLIELPKEIQILAELRALQGNFTIPEDDLIGDYTQWTYTPEGWKFWLNIHSGDFSPYYELYRSESFPTDTLYPEKQAVIDYVNSKTEWQPTKGEMVEVSNDEDNWYKEEFLGIAEKSDWKYIVYTSNEYDGIDNYMYCRKLQHEFTIDEARAIISKSKGIELEKIIIK